MGVQLLDHLINAAENLRQGHSIFQGSIFHSLRQGAHYEAARSRIVLAISCPTNFELFESFLPQNPEARVRSGCLIPKLILQELKSHNNLA